LVQTTYPVSPLNGHEFAVGDVITAWHAAKASKST